MASRVHLRIKAFLPAAFRLVQDTFFVRLVVSTIALWPRSRFPAVMLALLLACCLLLAGATARIVFDGLRPSITGILWPGLAAAFAFVVMLELTTASLMSALRAMLRLSLDTGRHRIGALLTMAAIVCVALAARAILSSAMPSVATMLGLSASLVVVLASAFWFERAYRRPAYPGFRDFHADVVDARHYLSRAAHGG